MQCVFIHGPVASGKRTVARALGALTGLPVHHNHLAVDAALSLFPFGSPGFCALRESIWSKAFDEAARAGRSFIFTFAPEATVRPKLIGELVAAVEAHEGRVRFVALTCDPDVCESRLDAPDRADFGKLSSKAEWRRLRDAGAFDFPPLPEPAITIATDTTDPDAAARLVRRRLTAP